MTDAARFVVRLITHLWIMTLQVFRRVHICLKQNGTLILAFATAILALIAYFQWRTMDDTLKANKIAERAFVGIVDMPFPYPIVRDGKIVGWHVAAVYENSGGSETRDLVMHIRYASPEKPFSNSFKISNFSSPNIASDVRRLLAPRVRISGNGICLTPTTIKSIVDGKKYFYIVAWATYKDRFNEPHLTEFCTQVIRSFETGAAPSDYPDLDGQKITPPPIGYYLCASHNCSDDECEVEDSDAHDRRYNSQPAKSAPPTQPDAFCQSE